MHVFTMLPAIKAKISESSEKIILLTRNNTNDNF